MRKNIHLHTFCLYMEEHTLRVFFGSFSCLSLYLPKYGLERLIKVTPAGHRFPLLILASLETFCKTKTNSISLDHTPDGHCAGAIWGHLKPYVELKCCILFKALCWQGMLGSVF